MTTWKKRTFGLLAFAVCLTLAAARPAVAQTPAATPAAATTTATASTATGSIHGHIINAVGAPVTAGMVKLTTDKSVQPAEARFPYSFPISAAGDYTGKDIAPGNYLAYVVQDGKYIDRMPATVAAGVDVAVDFDMTRAEYQKTLTPEEKKQLEAVAKQNATANADNKVIANLNATLLAVRADLKTASPNFDKDVSDMKQATDAKPQESILWIAYGNALLGSADSMASLDRNAGKPPLEDDAVVKQYAAAIDAYKKGVDLDAASKKPNVNDQAVAYNEMGTALAHAGKVEDAKSAYESAAKLVPANAGMYYGNEAAVLYDASQHDSSLGGAALEAANKAIAADPDKADDYYVKAQVLLQKATVDPKTQKVVLPDGCEDAYQHYLALAPNGKFAPGIKEILAGLDIKIDTTYKAGHSKKH